MISFSFILYYLESQWNKWSAHSAITQPLLKLTPGWERSTPPFMLSGVYKLSTKLPLNLNTECPALGHLPDRDIRVTASQGLGTTK